MAYAYIPQRFPRFVSRPLVTKLRPRQGRAGGGAVRTAPADRPPHTTHQQQASLPQLASPLHLQVGMALYNK